MAKSEGQQRIVLSRYKNQIILKIDEHEVMRLGHLEAMAFGEAIFKIGADIKQKESL